jgi:mono/diheme cytochrome c family protein
MALRCLVLALVCALTLASQSATQATRGAELYKTQCAGCHGASLEGASGPPLAGESFLANRNAEPVVNFVDKIQKTMPFGRAGTLSRPQSIDLAAYILQFAKVPAGAGDLIEARLAQLSFPAVKVAARNAAAEPEGNLAELMRAIAFPNSNILFNLQVKDPSRQQKKETNPVPFDYVEWGSTVYTGWLAVDQAAIALVETAPLLLAPGRRCQNGKPAPVDRADWKAYVADLIQVGQQARRASQARNLEAFVDISEKLNDACANCHKVYRDKGGTEGSGATRCQ